MAKKEIKRCVECCKYYSLRNSNPYHKTAYCSLGGKSVSTNTNKSIACDKFEPEQSFNKLLKGHETGKS